MRVLVGLENSQVITKAFTDRGHYAMSCDKFYDGELGLPHYKGDIFDVVYDGWDLFIAHPVCTYLTITGNKWFYHPEDKYLPVDARRPHPNFPDRLQQRAEAFEFFMDLWNVPIYKKCFENPVGKMSTYWRQPDQIIQPFEFGHPEPKKTCLWLQNLPLLKPTNIVEPEYHITKSGKRLPKWYAYADKSKGQAHRAKIRSRTFEGIARAMADQWG